MIEFLSIVLLIFGVLQIILFFKLWIMTNDVKKIKERVIMGHGVRYYLAIGDKEKAYSSAVEELYNELDKQASVRYNDEYFLEGAQKTIEVYRKIAEETGHELPEYLSDAQKFLDLRGKKWE